MALRKTGLSPKECIVIEDSENGVRAAKAAGMRVVATSNPYTEKESLSEADVIVTCLGDPDGKGVEQRLFEAAVASPEWIPAQVLGTIHADVEAARLLGPLWYGAVNPKLYNVARRDWWYRKDFTLPASQAGKGRDHNPGAFTVWLAGGGIKGGMSYSTSDELDFKAAEHPAYCYDLHATALHLLGINHEKLNFYNDGIQRRLTDAHGHVLKKILT